MNKVHYLEPDEEITKVINRIRQSEEDGVVLVVPRNSTLTQSVINLKLLKRSAIEHKKAIGLVSTDRITKNLAEQLQVKVFSQVAEAEKAMLIFETPVSASSQKDDSSLKVHTYRKYDLSKMNENERNGERGTGNEEPESDIIKLSKKPLEAEGAVYDPSDSTSSSAEATEDRQNKPEFDDEPIEQRNEEQETRNGETEEEIKSVPAENIEKDDDISYRSGSYKGKHLRTSGSRKPLLILFSSILVILAIIVGLFWPSAQATVTLKTADFEQKATILVDQNQQGFDSANNILNGTMVELEKSVSKSFDSTGKKDAGAIASGTITISNSTTKNVPISPNTKVTATDGKFFSIVTGVMVPAGSVDTSNCKSNPNGTVECSVIPGTVDAKVNAS
ncbi:MAG TPA: hypothetical protein VJK08_03590, partial [Patescibacteria group bacterium]|nr:hypothetical protein [Patescibacteria group bacterium]